MRTPSSTPSNSQTGAQYVSPASPPKRRSKISGVMFPKQPSSPPSTSPQNIQHQASPANSSRPATNIWQLMGYPIPRGPCKHKPGMLSPACACLRFMLNPVVAGSTFCCDGCGHHASFHVLKGEYLAAEGGDGMVGMDMVEMMQSPHRGQGHSHGPVVHGTPGKGKGKRLIELDLDMEDGAREYEEAGSGEDTGEVMVITRGVYSGPKGLSKQRIPGAFIHERPSGSGSVTSNGKPAAKRSKF